MRDIIELRCHLEDKGHQLKHLEKEKAKLEEANAKLQADVDYMKKHGPLLNSKWNQELEAVKEFSKKKIEVSWMEMHFIDCYLSTQNYFNYKKLIYL